jgi:hypothetical protein
MTATASVSVTSGNFAQAWLSLLPSDSWPVVGLPFALQLHNATSAGVHDRIYLISRSAACNASIGNSTTAALLLRTPTNYTAVVWAAGEYVACFYQDVAADGVWTKMAIGSSSGGPTSIIVRPAIAPANALPSVLFATTDATGAGMVAGIRGAAVGDTLVFFPTRFGHATSCAAAAAAGTTSDRRTTFAVMAPAPPTTAASVPFHGALPRSGEHLACYLGYPFTELRLVGYVLVLGNITGTAWSANRFDPATNAIVLDMNQVYTVTAAGAGLVSRGDAVRLVNGSACDVLRAQSPATLAGTAVINAALSTPAGSSSPKDPLGTVLSVSITATMSTAAATLCYRSNATTTTWVSVRTIMVEPSPSITASPTAATFAAGTVMRWRLSASRQLSGALDDVRVCDAAGSVTACAAVTSARDCSAASFHGASNTWMYPASGNSYQAKTYLVCARLRVAPAAAFVEAATFNITRYFTDPWSSSQLTPIGPTAADPLGEATVVFGTTLPAEAGSPTALTFVAANEPCGSATVLGSPSKPRVACATQLTFTAAAAIPQLSASVTVRANASCTGHVCAAFADGSVMRSANISFAVTKPLLGISPATVPANITTAVRILGCDRCDFRDPNGTAVSFCDASHGTVVAAVSADSVWLRVFTTAAAGAPLCFHGHIAGQWEQLTPAVRATVRLSGGTITVGGGDASSSKHARVVPAPESSAVNVTVEGFGIAADPSSLLEALAVCGTPNASTPKVAFIDVATPNGPDNLVTISYGIAAPLVAVGAFPLCFFGVPLSELSASASSPLPLYLIVDPFVVSVTPLIDGATATALGASNLGYTTTGVNRSLLLTLGAADGAEQSTISAAVVTTDPTATCTQAWDRSLQLQPSQGTCRCAQVVRPRSSSEPLRFECLLPPSCALDPHDVRICYVATVPNGWAAPTTLPIAAALHAGPPASFSALSSFTAITAQRGAGQDTSGGDSSVRMYSGCPMTLSAKGAVAQSLLDASSLGYSTPGASCEPFTATGGALVSNAVTGDVVYGLASASFGAPSASGTYATCGMIEGRRFLGSTFAVLPSIEVNISTGSVQVKCPLDSTTQFYLTVLDSTGNPRGAIALGPASSGTLVLPAVPVFGYAVYGVRTAADGSVSTLAGATVASFAATTATAAQRETVCRSTTAPGTADAKDTAATQFARRLILALNLEASDCREAAETGRVTHTNAQALLTELQAVIAATNSSVVLSPRMTFTVMGDLLKTTGAAPAAGSLPSTLKGSALSVGVLLAATSPQSFIDAQLNQGSGAPGGVVPGTAAPNRTLATLEVAAGQLAMLEPFAANLRAVAEATEGEPVWASADGLAAAATAQRASAKLVARLQELAQLLCATVPYGAESSVESAPLQSLRLVVRHRRGDGTVLRLSPGAALQLSALSTTECVMAAVIATNILPQRTATVIENALRQSATDAPATVTSDMQLPHFTLPMVCVFGGGAGDGRSTVTLTLGHATKATDVSTLRLHLYRFRVDSGRLADVVTATTSVQSVGSWQRAAVNATFSRVESIVSAALSTGELALNSDGDDAGSDASIFSGTVTSEPPTPDAAAARELIYGFAILQCAVLLIHFCGGLAGHFADVRQDKRFMAQPALSLSSTSSTPPSTGSESSSDRTPTDGTNNNPTTDSMNSISRSVTQPPASFRTLHRMMSLFTRPPMNVCGTAAKVTAWAAHSSALVLGLWLLLTTEIVDQLRDLLHVAEYAPALILGGGLLAIIIAPMAAPARVGLHRHRDDKPCFVGGLLATLAAILAYLLSGEDVVLTAATSVAASLVCIGGLGFFLRRRWSVTPRMRSMVSAASSFPGRKDLVFGPATSTAAAEGTKRAAQADGKDDHGDGGDGGCDTLFVFGAFWAACWELTSFSVTVASLARTADNSPLYVPRCVMSINLPFDSLEATHIPALAFPSVAFVAIVLFDSIIIEPLKVAVLLFCTRGSAASTDIHVTIHAAPTAIPPMSVPSGSATHQRQHRHGRSAKALPDDHSNADGDVSIVIDHHNRSRSLHHRDERRDHEAAVSRYYASIDPMAAAGDEDDGTVTVDLETVQDDDLFDFESVNGDHSAASAFAASRSSVASNPVRRLRRGASYRRSKSDSDLSDHRPLNVPFGMTPARHPGPAPAALEEIDRSVEFMQGASATRAAYHNDQLRGWTPAAADRAAHHSPSLQHLDFSPTSHNDLTDATSTMGDDFEDIDAYSATFQELDEAEESSLPVRTFPPQGSL